MRIGWVTGLALLALAACGMESAERTFDVDIEVPSELEHLRIIPASGPVMVSGSDTDRITGTVVATARGYRTDEEARERVDSVQLVADFDGEAGELRVVLPPQKGFDSLTIALEILVPRHLLISVSGADDQVIVGYTGVGLISGVNARVDLVGTSGDAEVATSNAPVAVRVHEGDLTVDTTNGGVRLRDVMGSVMVQTTHAPIDVTAFPEPGGEILLQTVGHDVVLGISQDFGASFVGEARVGRVSVGNLPLTRERDEPDLVRGQIGVGEGTIRIFTRNGNIAVNGLDVDEVSP